MLKTSCSCFLLTTLCRSASLLGLRPQSSLTSFPFTPRHSFLPICTATALAQDLLPYLLHSNKYMFTQDQWLTLICYSPFYNLYSAKLNSQHLLCKLYDFFFCLHMLCHFFCLKRPLHLFSSNLNLPYFEA